MLTGIKLRAHPTSHQKLILSQWMGCARSIWNAKVEEERYYRTYARKYCGCRLAGFVEVVIGNHSAQCRVTVVHIGKVSELGCVL